MEVFHCPSNADGYKCLFCVCKLVCIVITHREWLTSRCAAIDLEEMTVSGGVCQLVLMVLTQHAVRQNKHKRSKLCNN